MMTWFEYPKYRLPQAIPYLMGWLEIAFLIAWILLIFKTKRSVWLMIGLTVSIFFLGQWRFLDSVLRSINFWASEISFHPDIDNWNFELYDLLLKISKGGVYLVSSSVICAVNSLIIGITMFAKNSKQ